MAITADEKAALLARIEALEAGTSDGDTLTAAWRGVKQAPLNLRTRLRKAIASSPSLPPSIAVAVMLERPVEVFHNPALPLLLLELPDLLQRAPRAFWNAALTAPSLPPSLLPALVASCPYARMGELARRPEFEAADAPALLQRLLYVLMPVDAPPWPLTDDEALALCQQWSEPMLDLPARVVEVLRAAQADARATMLLARCAQVPPDEALALRQRGHDIERSLGARRDLSAADLDHIATTSMGDARTAVAANPAASGDTLARLVRDHHPEVSAAAMLNPSLPRSAYELLLKRGTARRRALLAARPDLTADDYDMLSQAGELEVRLAVAQNPRAPLSALRRLAADLLDEVREAAQANPSFVPEPAGVITDAPTEEKPDEGAAKAPAKGARRRKVEPTLLERARPMLLGNMSAKARWEEVLAWVEAGGPRPKRATLSPQDRKRLLRGGVKLLGDDPSVYDAQQTRLLAGVIDALGCMPELNTAYYRALRAAGAEAQRDVAERWISRLVAAGFTEAQSLAMMLDRRDASKYGAESGWTQQILGVAALRPRLDAVVSHATSLSPAKVAARFVEDVSLAMVGLSLPREEFVRRAAALVVGARESVTGHPMAVLAQHGGEALFDAFDPTLADELLRALDLRYAWSLPKPVVERARRLQQEQG